MESPFWRMRKTVALAPLRRHSADGFAPELFRGDDEDACSSQAYFIQGIGPFGHGSSPFMVTQDATAELDGVSVKVDVQGFGFDHDGRRRVVFDHFLNGPDFEQGVVDFPFLGAAPPGEPTVGFQWPVGQRVYPCACGGWLTPSAQAGLSLAGA